MTKLVTLTIDDQEISVPEGTLVVDAAKMTGVDIPVFCYHPKLEPVGMCRMCLVDVGRPVRDRATGELELEEDGSPKIQFGPKLETACTLPVSEGMVVRGVDEHVQAARKDVVEFLLTSHPLDCPICDKGGECPLQDLTMDFGPGKSRFLFDEKIQLAKHVPLGDLIFLDRERCIQCARCTRFQQEIVDDPVIGFEQRGRALQIVTYSEPGFDSYFSGNTTDICPVGALTTADFRFGARPWELTPAASICPHCPVGCNLTMNVRREAKAGGDVVIKRVMPRQNEWVNELWICDKGRFGYHFSESDERLTEPMIRDGDGHRPASWEEAYELIAAKVHSVAEGLTVLGSGRLANEDLFILRNLAQKMAGDAFLYSEMGGGELVAQVGLGQGTNFADMGPGTAILVVACDLEEEAPIWWLRVKQAAERGATLIVANPRQTKLDRYAAHHLQYPYGGEAAAVLALINALSAKKPDLPDEMSRLALDEGVKAAAQAFADAEDAVVIFGSEGTGLDTSQALAQACANLLIATDHLGRPNNGLLAVWERANNQGAWDMGFRPERELKTALGTSNGLYVVGADPAGDDPDLAVAVQNAKFVVVQDLFMTETARLADVVLPAQAFTEREGTFTSGERRVQRFYPVVPSRPGPRPDFAIAAQIANALGFEDIDGRAPSLIFKAIAEAVPGYEGLDYRTLAKVEPQWPIIGHDQGDRYYGGTAFENAQGLGVQLQPGVQRGESVSLAWQAPREPRQMPSGLMAVPITRLYDRGRLLAATDFMAPRLANPHVLVGPQEAQRLGISSGTVVLARLNGAEAEVRVDILEDLTEGIVLVPRSMGLPIRGPAEIELKIPERETS